MRRPEHTTVHPASSVAVEPGASPPAGSTALEGASAGTGLVRVTVNLTPRSMNALERLSAGAGESKTDAINKALQVYAYLQEVIDQEAATLLIRHANGDVERLRFIM